MAERLGRAIWQGVQGFISCSYTVSHGITPGIAALTIPEQDVSKIAPFGMLVFTDGVGTVKLPRCKVVDVQFAGGGGSPRTMTLMIADRRWMWRFGRISGNWNVIDPYPDPNSYPPDEFVISGGPYAPGTYRTADKLIADCLRALNEINPLVEPAPAYPVAMNWDNETPAAALQAVCDAIGYRVVYRPHIDQVAIVPAGVGIPLPLAGLSVISGSDGIDPPERPNVLQLVGGDTIWNDYLELEPVTLEQSGAVVKLDDASYKPRNGWGRTAPPEFGEVYVQHGPEKCELAQRHIWRTFRVKMRDVVTQREGFIDIPRYGKVTDRKQIVLGSQLYGTSKDERGQLRTEPPYVVGSAYFPHAFTRPENSVTLGAFGNTITGNERIQSRPTILSDRGLVTFDRYLFKNAAINAIGVPIPVGNAGAFESPSLYLRTSFRIRSLAGMVFDQFQAAGAGAVAGDPLCPPETVRRPELVAVINVVRNASKSFRLDDVTDNLDELKQAAEYYLKAADQQYKISIKSERTYAGIIPLLPDGAIAQITWSVGGGAATTQASRNSEHATFIPSFAERRRRERLNNFWALPAAGGTGPNITSPGHLNELIRVGIGAIYGRAP